MVDVIESDESKEETKPIEVAWETAYGDKVERVLTEDEWEQFSNGSAVVEIMRNGSRNLVCANMHVYDVVRKSESWDNTPLVGDIDDGKTSYEWGQFGVGVRPAEDGELDDEPTGAELMAQRIEETGMARPYGKASDDEEEEEEPPLHEWVRCDNASSREWEAAEKLFDLFKVAEGEQRTRAQEALHKLGYRVEKRYMLKSDDDN